MLGLSTADVLSLSQLGAGVLALFAAAWVYRQGRRAVQAAEERCAASARAQGERLGALEQQLALLNLRRRQTEAQLVEQGIELAYWPDDDDGQPRARPRRAYDDDVAPPTRFLTDEERAQLPSHRR